MMGTNGRKSLSKQELMSCNTEQYGCKGGNFPPAFEEARKGMALEDDYPYYPGHATSFPWSGTGARCQWGEKVKPIIVSAHYPVQPTASTPEGLASIQKEIYCKGPVTAGFQIKSNFFSHFAADKTSVYMNKHTATATDVGGHAVTMVGWGIWESPADGNVPYWELMNSWGEGWGNNGFFRMERGVNLCFIETMTIHAADVEPTTGSWMYGDWSTCDVALDKKTRPIVCKSHTGVLQERETCPNADMSFWPNVFEFPSTTSTKYQEVEAIKSCTDTPAECTMFGACKGNGDASLNGGVCSCACYQHYQGDSCDSCTDGASGFPRCRENCVATDCNSHGTASGNKWKTEFGDPRDSCECACTAGFAGDECEKCANPKTHTYPHCHGSIAPYTPPPATTSPEPTTTTLPPCRIDRGPIELMPPTGKTWIALNCDVRRRDCEPDKDRCLGLGQYENITTYKQYCKWANNTEFPTGQCLNKENSTYHARIEGTERDGEGDTPAMNKSKVAIR